MQDFIVHIIVGICVVWAGVLIYRSLKSQRRSKCAGCPLGSSCRTTPGAAGCTEDTATPGSGTGARVRNTRHQ